MRLRVLKQTIKLLAVTLCILSLSPGNMYASPWENPAVETNAVQTVNNVSETYSKLSLTFVGDLLMHSLQRESGYNPLNNTYNFDYFFKDIKKYFEGKDFVFGSLETPLVKLANDPAYTGYPCFKNPPQFLEAIKNAGINVLATATNHSFDQGASGCLETLRWIDNYGVPATGTFQSQSDRDTNPVLFLEKNDIKLAFTSYTQISNLKIPEGNPYMLNLIDFNKIKKDIAFAKANKADLIIVWLHFGPEYVRQATPYQKEAVKKIAELGADIIIGSHPHMLEPLEVQTVDQRKVFVAYSLGNFVSNQYWRYSTDGLILNIDVEKKDGKVDFLNNITYIPTGVVREYTGNIKLTDKDVKESFNDYDILTYNSSIKGSDVKFRVVAVRDALANYKNKLDKNLTNRDIKQLEGTLSDTLGLLGRSQYFKPYEP